MSLAADIHPVRLSEQIELRNWRECLILGPSCYRHWHRSALHVFLKNIKVSELCKLVIKSAQSLAPESVGPERPLPALLAPLPVNSSSRITLENNGKIRPQPDRENAFARASGGGDGTGSERSPSQTRRQQHWHCPENLRLKNGLTQILLEAVHLMHALVKDRDDADVAI